MTPTEIKSDMPVGFGNGRDVDVQASLNGVPRLKSMPNLNLCLHAVVVVAVISCATFTLLLLSLLRLNDFHCSFIYT